MRRGLSETLGQETLRCGRCASILPDETLSYCPACGVLFATVPPTTSYVTLESHYLRKARRLRYIQLGAATVLSLVVSLGVVLGSFDLYRQQLVERMPSQRELHFYIHQDEQFEGMPRHEIHQAIAVGLQAFEDHFGYRPAKWKVNEDQLPEMLVGFFDENPSDQRKSLSKWENFLSGAYISNWWKNPYTPLPILITNQPIQAIQGESTRVETKHLSESQLVSGLGHPALVVVSLTRTLKEIKFNRAKEQVRYVGEYLIAHELGHALLGLVDYIVPEGLTPQQATLRQPATIHGDLSCLMHTDVGGGHGSWESLRTRKLGRNQDCGAYHRILEAHRVRNLALEKLKDGKRQEGRKLMERALIEIGDESNPWLESLWKRERMLYLGFFESWTASWPSN